MTEAHTADELEAFSKEFGDLDFDVWPKGDESDAKILEMFSAEVVNEQAMYARIAYGFLRKSKEEIIATMGELEKAEHHVVDWLEEAEGYYRAVHKVIEGTLARIVVAAAHDIKNRQDKEPGNG